jgi:CRP-like cAMP-binding protein
MGDGGNKDGDRTLSGVFAGAQAQVPAKHRWAWWPWRRRTRKTGARHKINRAVATEQVRRSDLLSSLPRENLEAMLDRMETLGVSKGEQLIAEGSQGDYYFLLVEGAARVVRNLPDGSGPSVLADIAGPAAFGEEALISNARRNASVVMASDGVVMRLSREAFNEFVKDPLLTWVSAPEASAEVLKGAVWLDVRNEPNLSDRLPNAVAVPLEKLRVEVDELRKDVRYICYCENGRTSSTAAFLLRQRGFDVAVLRGGLARLRAR